MCDYSPQLKVLYRSRKRKLLLSFHIVVATCHAETKQELGFGCGFLALGKKRSTIFCCSGQNRSTASLALGTVSKGTRECVLVPKGQRVKSVHLSGDFRVSVRGEKMEVLIVIE